MQKGGCSARDTITIRHQPAPLVNLGRDTALCSGTTLLLDATGSDIDSYSWQNGDSDPAFVVQSAGTYWVQVKGVNGCRNADTLRVSERRLPSVSWGSDTVLCGATLVLAPVVSDGSLLWQDGSTGPTFTVQQPGSYTVKATNACGSVADAVTVSRGLCDLFLPNAFTPNGDGLNDLFRVKYPQFIKTFTMKIFNRWGEVVYSTANPSEGWNGQYKSRHQPVGVYVWLVALEDINGVSRSYKGTVTLIR